MMSGWIFYGFDSSNRSMHLNIDLSKASINIIEIQTESRWMKIQSSRFNAGKTFSNIFYKQTRRIQSKWEAKAGNYSSYSQNRKLFSSAHRVIYADQKLVRRGTVITAFRSTFRSAVQHFCSLPCLDDKNKWNRFNVEAQRPGGCSMLIELLACSSKG